MHYRLSYFYPLLSMPFTPSWFHPFYFSLFYFFLPAKRSFFTERE
ncbi:hypothetical protein HMPREF3213_01013 [Heyndrickxia coagulans]|uniref:Uncharacterized protein n=1 Tax=Heyndrickxia coagulans TaxID=1398 RepID=A0A133KX22_HEYCO|nr:hypothetical protein HMPREF3213_01013 [Heyndrickxia coagulans]